LPRTPFIRPFRGIEKLFPKSTPTTSDGSPVSVLEDVQPVWDVFGQKLGEVRFRHFRVAAVAAPGDNLVVLLEPTAGRVFRNVKCCAFTDKATNTDVIVAINITGGGGGASDPWGLLATQLAQVNYTILVPSRPGEANVLPVIPKGNVHELTFKAMAGGENIVVNWFFYDAPGEITTLDAPF